MSSSCSLHFVLANAFTSDPDCGNPAGVFFLPQTCLPDPTTPYTTEKIQALAKNINQPVSAFISPLPSDQADQAEVDYAIRFFTPQNEVRICGHGTLASTKAILAFPELAAIAKLISGVKDKEVPRNFRFKTASGNILQSRRLSVPHVVNEGEPTEYIQLSFPHCPTVPIPLDSASGMKILSALSGALNKPKQDVDVIYMGYGTGTYSFYVLIELGVEEGLEGKEVVTEALKQTGYRVNILTTASRTGKEAFISRMFAPLDGIHEDHVCGSAHCLLTPYWATKRAAPSAPAPSSEADEKALEAPMKARAVSSRGGTLHVNWDRKGETVNLSGEGIVWGRGEILL